MCPGIAPAPHGAAQPRGEKDTHQVEVLLGVQILHCEEQETTNSSVRALHPHEDRCLLSPRSTSAQPGFLLPVISAPFSAWDHIALHHTAGPGEHSCQFSVSPQSHPRNMQMLLPQGTGLTSAQRAVLLVRQAHGQGRPFGDLRREARPSVSAWQLPALGTQCPPRHPDTSLPLLPSVGTGSSALPYQERLS